ncbi:MAG TPA: TIGR03435 family protein, partial [Vicinamibacterales bacterium]
FDVADIKIAAPDAQISQRIQPNGRIDLQGVTMKMLFQVAWDVNDDDLLAGAPKWFDTTKYSLVARASSIVSDPSHPNNVQIDIDDTRAMLRALLIERFKIVTHIEQRPIDAYTLVVADKAKLQPADPANRTKRFEGVLPGVKDPREANPALSRIVTVQNMTMAQFAEELASIAPGYLREPVVDATGIDGAWDFVLSFSPNGLANNNGAGSGSGALAASAPTGALSLLDALPKELGLKLEQRKRPLPVLVIDHIEEQPVDR